MNVQFAVKDETVYVLEVNPRASRTVPFVSKAIGVPLAEARREGHGRQDAQGTRLHRGNRARRITRVKEAVFPFIRFPGIDIVLGPEMKSTGEVMGIDANLGLAYAKAQMAAQPALPHEGQHLHQRRRRGQKPKVAEIARGFAELGFTLFATSGTAAALKAAGVPVKKLFKLTEGRPNALDMIKNGELALIINTPERQSRPRGRSENPQHRQRTRIPIMTTLRAAARQPRRHPRAEGTAATA